ncbi:uncharacterized protein LAESUDRAFT_757825 [Laetiporus sulphureus 93-53]|uniref:Uncharacterized protein n=1 Tax=Laetiporus sulphureus 93-53 TaxID=1314785 RepID=A0A165F0W9_9APHY|nr:uncharacterized protein LAESUDRAFT_757825 [Laetiporus sulphureus 93-53]KZT08132.1 hypothetical protein LAESUDRAFT_757825 [Laetiporus sulphureus 93-53]
MPPMRRPLTPPSRDALLARRRAHSAPIARRQLATAPAMDLPANEVPQPPPEFQIFDIFDAPSRLGESSKLLRASSSSRTLPSRSSPSSSRKVSPVRSLPDPVIFDGPTRPRILQKQYEARRSHSTALGPRGSLRSLPLPEIFDGPSRLRPYARSEPFHWLATSSLLLLGLTGVVGICGWQEAKL